MKAGRSPILPPVVRLGPVVQLSPEACWRLFQLATRGAAEMSRGDGLNLSPFTRDLLRALADAARHGDTDCRCARHDDTSPGPDSASSGTWVATTEAAGVLGLSPRSVQRLRHEIGGFRRTTRGLEFDREAVSAYAQVRARQREERDG